MKSKNVVSKIFQNTEENITPCPHQVGLHDDHDMCYDNNVRNILVSAHA